LTDIDASPETIQRLVELVAEHSLTEIEVEQDGLSIRVKALVAAPSALVHAASFSSTHSVAASPAVAAASAKSRARALLTPVPAPMVGTFYRKPAPDDPPYIDVGDRVEIGQTIGKIEAMKVFSDIPAEIAGRVVEIVAADAQLVQLGQPLMYLDPQ
jgi:acetyl-CoA carboxylase biotin carboxyl carrier protein